MSVKASPMGDPITVYAGAYKQLDFTLKQRGAKINIPGGGVSVRFHVGYVNADGSFVGQKLLTKQWSLGDEDGIALRSGGTTGGIRVNIDEADTQGTDSPLTLGAYWCDIWVSVEDRWFIAMAPTPFTVAPAVGL